MKNKHHLEFNDPHNWLDIIREEVRKTYIIPTDMDLDVCVDLGANVGGFFVENHMKFKKIFSFEASKNTFEEACLNMNRYGIKNVNLYNLAAYKSSDQIVRLKHFGSPNDPDNAHINNRSGNASVSNVPKYKCGTGYIEDIYEEVKSISLEGIESIIDQKRINYLKCDIECGEFDFFINKKLDNIDFISMELHCNLGFEKIKSLINHLEVYFKYYKSKRPSKLPNVDKNQFFHLNLNLINKNL